MKLILQPDGGIEPLLSGIRSAKTSVEIVIFRFDWREIEAALKAAVGHGARVHALIAYTNKGGEKNLRKLEARLLGAGVTVARTANDLARYHDKMMLIDRKVLYVLSFNFTHADIERSRAFGIVTRNSATIREAVKLFGADTTRNTYTAGLDTLVVSPSNARKLLGGFIQRARKQLLIYDPKIADKQMVKFLEDRAQAGVEIRIIGRLGKPNPILMARRLQPLRLHTRTIIRDGRQAFVGSQSLRQAELDSRRELGIIIHDARVVSALVKTFEADWAGSEQPKSKEDAKALNDASKTERVVKKAVKRILKEQPHLAPIAQEAVKQVIEEAGSMQMNHKEVQETVTEAVKEAVKTEEVQEAITKAIKETVQDS